MKRKRWLFGLLAGLGLWLGSGPTVSTAAMLDPVAGELAREIAASHGQSGPAVQRVAVADFSGPGTGRCMLGQYLAVKVEIALQKQKVFPEFIDRRYLDPIIEELNLQLSDLFDPKTAAELGKFSGVQALVVGRITDLGDRIDITAKLIDTTTARSLAVADATCEKKGRQVASLIKPLTGTVTVRVTPAVNGRIRVAGRSIPLSTGSAVIEALPYGSYQLMIEPEEMDSVTQGVVVDGDTIHTEINLSRPACPVAFEVLPADAMLSVDGRRIALNAQGYARVADLTGGDHSFRAMAEGFRPRIETFDPCRKSVILLDLTATDPFYEMKSAFLKKVKQVSQRQNFALHLSGNQERYATGDAIVFTVQSEKDCYLNLVNIGSSGNVTLLFPNRYHPDNFVRAGTVHRIPDEHYGFSFTVRPPLKDETVYALASNRPLKLFDTDFARNTFAGLTRGNTRDIAIQTMGQNIDGADLAAAAVLVVRKMR